MAAGEEDNAAARKIDGVIFKLILHVLIAGTKRTNEKEPSAKRQLFFVSISRGDLSSKHRPYWRRLTSLFFIGACFWNYNGIDNIFFIFGFLGLGINTRLLHHLNGVTDG